MRDRRNVCPEEAVKKAAERLYPDLRLNYNPEANNDSQCDLNPLFKALPAQDHIVSNAALGGYAAQLGKDAEQVNVRIRSESRYNPQTVQEYKFEHLAQDENGEVDMLAFENDPEVIAERQKFTRYMQELCAPMNKAINQAFSEELNTLTPPNTYLLHSGTVDVEGHFHIVYYQEPNWILNSGSTEGILYNTRTHALGPMAESLMSPSVTWGLGRGQRMLSFYEMTAERTLAAAQYIEQYRTLDETEAENIFPEFYVNRVIADPHYLSTFGHSEYWQAKTRRGEEFSLPPISNAKYIGTALKQCISGGFVGAIIQLKNRGYFGNPEQGRRLLATLLANNKVDAVNEIFRQNLVDLNNPAHGIALYKAALRFSRTNPDYPPGLNPSLRALQDKLLETLDPAQLPFTIQDACEAINVNALQTMLTYDNNVHHAELIDIVKTSAQTCGANQSTYRPMLELIRTHEQAARRDAVENSKPAKRVAREERPTVKKDTFRRTLIELRRNTAELEPHEAWELACDALDKRRPYVCATSNLGKTGCRPVEYQAETADGRTITKVVSEREQILLDRLLAQKLEAGETFRFRR